MGVCMFFHFIMTILFFVGSVYFIWKKIILPRINKHLGITENDINEFKEE